MSQRVEALARNPASATELRVSSGDGPSGTEIEPAAMVVPTARELRMLFTAQQEASPPPRVG